MNNQDTNQTVLNSTSQDTNQPEAVAPVTDNQQTTPATASATDTKPADSTQDTTASTPVAPTASTVSDTVKLELTADEAEMVQDLLSNYVYAYRSDCEVDCKRELVRRDQVGKYPYVAEAPDPSIINPTFDWFNKKWHSKNNAESLPELEADIQAIQQAQIANSVQSQTVTQQVGQMTQMTSGMKTTSQSLATGSGTQPTQPAGTAQTTTANVAQTTEATQQGGNK